MANIIPQAPNVNRKTWIKVERYERKLAVKYGKITVLNGVNYSDNPERIGKNKVAVPDSFYKVLYNKENNIEKCFFYKNDKSTKSKGDKLKQHLVECDTLL